MNKTSGCCSMSFSKKGKKIVKGLSAIKKNPWLKNCLIYQLDQENCF